ncbi:MAG: hypothetical protein ACRCT1_07165 [Microcoleaceae cyanobacterium]
MARKPGNPNFGKTVRLPKRALISASTEAPLVRAITTRFDEDTFCWVKAFADSRGITANDVVRHAIIRLMASEQISKSKNDETT